MAFFIIFCVLLIVAVLLLRVIFSLTRKPAAQWRPDETTFTDPATNQAHAFHAVFDAPTRYLSLVVPAYKEQDRLPSMLDETLTYLKQREARDPSFTWEIIVVDDGSPDRTTAVAQQYVLREGTDHVRVLKLLQNRGKGGAVRRGMMYIRGQYALMVDADGATRINDIETLERDVKRVENAGFGVAVGSRAHMEDSDATAQRKFHRKILMFVFHMLVDVLCVKGVRDTQCGFKLFTRQAVSILFPNLHIERWAFDVELLFMAQQLGMPIAECAVNWQEIAGSKIDPLTASIQMARDLFRIRLMYVLGVWALPSRQEVPALLPVGASRSETLNKFL